MSTSISPPEMVAVVRQAVETGEYASRGEVVRDALHDWTQKRSLRRQGIDELRQVWRQAREDKTPGVPVHEVLARLERKDKTLADAGKVCGLECQALLKAISSWV